MNPRYLAYGLLLTWALIGFLLVLALVGCETPVGRSPWRSVHARITFYDKYEDRFHSRTATGGHACEGVTVAAPRVLPFGIRVLVPQLRGIVGSGTFTIEDRGSALERAYYRHGQLRLDVYVESRSKLRWCKYNLPEYMEATLE